MRCTQWRGWGRPSTAVVGAALLIGCDAEQRAPAGVEHIDSAGVAIVRHGDPWTLDVPAMAVAPEPHVRIGAVEGAPAELLDGVRDVRVTEDGRVFVANSGSGEVRVYGPDGVHLATLGGSGEGPGEFERMEWIALLPADTVLVHDGRLGRLTWLGLGGQVHRTAATRVGSEPVAPDLIAVLDDGSWLGTYDQLVATSRDSTRVERDEVTLGRFSAQGERTHELGAFPADELFIRAGSGSVSNSELPFGRSTTFAEHGGQVYVGDNDTFRVDVLDLDGRLVRSVRATVSLEPLSTEDVRADRERRLAALDESGPLARRLFGDAVMETPYPDRLPAYETILVAPGGELWVKRYPPPGSELNAWAVFGPDGEMRARVELPAGLEVMDVGASHVAGVVRDELDVEYVVVYVLDGN